MIYIVQNLVPILLATAAGLAVGALWFRPSRLSVGFTLTFVLAEFWLCAILAGALILAPPRGGVWTMSLGSAFVIWVGFVAPVIAATYRVRAIPARAAVTDSLHWLAVMLVQAIVLRLVGLVAPPL